MKDNTFPYKLYLVTDEASCLGRDLIWVAEQAVKGGADLVQLREKQLQEPAFLEKALRLKEMLDRYNVPLIINDNPAVGMRSGSAGLHVGCTDIRPVKVRGLWPEIKILGYSIEYEDQLCTADAAASSYLALSPVFATPTKTNTVTEWKLEGITKIKAITNSPIVAIGGINETNAASVIKAGADCLAVVSAICSANDPARAAEKLRNQIEIASKR